MLNNNFQDQLTNIKKSAKFFYFQNILPNIGGVINIFREPKQLLDRAFPSQIGMWFAIAFAVAGLLILLNPDIFWKWQFLLIIIVLLLGPLLYKLFQNLMDFMRKMLLVYPGKEYVGQTFVLDHAIIEGEAAAELDGNSWKFSGEDMPAGTSVKVVAVKDDILFVVPADVNTQQLEGPGVKS